jgi:ferredoxin
VASAFEVLGVDPDADAEAVEAAYRRRVKETHPDRGGSVEAFRRVRRASEAIESGAAVADDGDGGRAGPEDGEAGAATVDVGSDEAAAETVHVEYLNYDVLADRGWSLDDPDLFERAAAADLGPADHGAFGYDGEGPLLAAAEAEGHTWPYACRGGACANCAVAVVEGDLEMTVDNVLTDEMLARGIALSCVGRPATDRLRIVYNVKHLPDLEELRLPPGPFGRAHPDR